MRELRCRRRCGARGALAGVAMAGVAMVGVAMVALPALPVLLALPAILGGAALAAAGVAPPPPAAAARTAAWAAGGPGARAPGSGSTLVIGVTLHPYYSWTRNIVGDLPGFEVRPILPGEIDAGDYQPRPEDIRKLADLDALVVNGIGHDDFISPMLRASGNRKV